jgi:hypothetical protein
MRIAGSVFWRGEEGYEQARTEAVWNARKPGRYPAVIVQAVAEDDVVAAVGPRSCGPFPPAVKEEWWASVGGQG